MTAIDTLFVFFSLAVVLSGLMVILSPNPVISALYLVLVFVFTAGLFVLLQAFFLAILQVLVYAGAIMVLFLFIMMMLDARQPRRWWAGNLPALVGGPLLGLAFGLCVWTTLRRTTWPEPAPGTLFRGDLAAVITPLFSRYLLPVEITALLLLAATIGVVVLTRREERP
jgi:NADH-quinone oxidoreductase subunit J